MMRAVITMMLCAVTCAGCSYYRVGSTDTSTDFFLPKGSPDEVVYLEKIDTPYVVIGEVNVTALRTSPRDEILVKMRYEASILGADAITDMISDNAPVRTRYTAKAVVLQ